MTQPAQRSDEPIDYAAANKLLAEAFQRWAQMPDLTVELHPLLAPVIGQGMREIARGPRVNPRMRALLLAEGHRLQQFAPESSLSPQTTPPVTLTLPRQAALATMAVLQILAHHPRTPPNMRNLAHAEGRTLQHQVCDHDDLHALIDTGWPLTPPAAPQTGPRRRPADHAHTTEHI